MLSSSLNIRVDLGNVRLFIRLLFNDTLRDLILILLMKIIIKILLVVPWLVGLIFGGDSLHFKRVFYLCFFL